jgi:hypothetical protein
VNRSHSYTSIYEHTVPSTRLAWLTSKPGVSKSEKSAHPPVAPEKSTATELDALSQMQNSPSRALQSIRFF